MRYEEKDLIDSNGNIDFKYAKDWLDSIEDVHEFLELKNDIYLSEKTVSLLDDNAVHNQLHAIVEKYKLETEMIFAHNEREFAFVYNKIKATERDSLKYIIYSLPLAVLIKKVW